MASSEVCDLVGGDSLKDPPVPIPNTEVKLQGADGTAGETRWEVSHFYGRALLQGATVPLVTPASRV